MGHPAVLLIALIVDRIIGDPDWLWRRISHPVVLFGHAIGFADRKFNRPTDRAGKRRRNGNGRNRGAADWCCHHRGRAGQPVRSSGPCRDGAGSDCRCRLSGAEKPCRSCGSRGARLAQCWPCRRTHGGFDDRRGAIPRRLMNPVSHAQRLRALAENFSDGIVAPALWYALFGLPGLLAYKMLNTADSMIGHLNERHRDFGRAAARLDDFANWPAARLSALLIAAGAGLSRGVPAMRRAAETALTDSGLHRSPQCRMARGCDGGRHRVGTGRAASVRWRAGDGGEPPRRWPPASGVCGYCLCAEGLPESMRQPRCAGRAASSCRFLSN
jgi:adenosylcobinamide-phosphate synthase